MGYHFQAMIRRLSKFKLPALPAAAIGAALPAEAGDQE